MDNNYKKEARKQFFHYFRFWFLAVGILAVLCAAVAIVNLRETNVPRANNSAPKERVYDYADVLTDEEEEKLRQYIAKQEAQLQIDIVVVTIDQPVEGQEAREQYGYRYTDWKRNMQDIADDFWDENGFGYNKSREGDGVLLLQNWYMWQDKNLSQAGEHLSTSGRAEWKFSNYDIDRVLDAVGKYYAKDPYRAFEAYVDQVGRVMNSQSEGETQLPWFMVFGLPIFVALIYAIVHMTQNKAKNTTAVNAYVVGGKGDMRGKRDDFLRKTTSSRRINTDSGSHGSGGRSSGHSGGGGHHHSSSGASHGGGSRRH